MLKLGFLRAYEKCSLSICLVMGIFGMVYFLIIFYSNFNPLIQSDSRQSICVAYFIVFTLLFVSSILLVIGKKEKNKILIASFNIIVPLITFVLFILAIVSSSVPFKIMKNTCLPNQQVSPTWQQNLQSINNIANQVFCQKQCPCYINEQTFNQYNASTQTQMYAQLPYMSIYSSQYSNQFSNCLTYKNLTQQQKRYSQIMANLEKGLSCSGWCNISITNMFTPSVNFVPYQSCQSSLVNFYNQWGKKCALTSWILFLIMLFNTTMILCKLFHPGNKHKGFYERIH